MNGHWWSIYNNNTCGYQQSTKTMNGNQKESSFGPTIKPLPSGSSLLAPVTSNGSTLSPPNNVSGSLGVKQNPVTIGSNKVPNNKSTAMAVNQSCDWCTEPGETYKIRLIIKNVEKKFCSDTCFNNYHKSCSFISSPNNNHNQVSKQQMNFGSHGSSKDRMLRNLSLYNCRWSPAEAYKVYLRLIFRSWCPSLICLPEGTALCHVVFSLLLHLWIFLTRDRRTSDCIKKSSLF